MSREIKFRIWDDKKKEWLGESDGDTLTYYGFHLVGEVMTVQAPPQWALDEGMVVEQYTGFKDKKEREVYEGDIVEFVEATEPAPCSVGRPKIIGTAVFEHDRYVLKTKSGEFYKVLCVWLGEVVGNIHENPELLKGEK